ncbi:DUF418 domain-containing protein [Leptospira ognonensis]|uniref:DUF418 domain-containing protein n=1 Tax=Leptospira ognonensis TaxID=2484945 RepID=A0A4R9JY33_9LEPT|nr:DUF418 domain-containing protein [Leptospira ognonensis]TGL58131.1 DUF418 domain-containing protein [Leptospira ognonensis]
MNSENRVLYLDLLRGFAIFGILISNLPVIAEPPFGMKINHTDLSKLFTSLGYFFVTGKFFLIFSFVFGYGFTILLNSSETKGFDTKRIFFRRLLGLLLLGILHACFFFNGDILITYSLLGVFLYKSKDASLSDILKMSLYSWIVSALFYGIIGLLIHYGSKEDPALTKTLTDQSIQGYLGNFTTATLQRLKEIKLTFPFIILFNWPSAFCLFLVGLWMGRQNTLNDPNTFFQRFSGYWIYIFVLGVISNSLFVWVNLESISYLSDFFTGASLAIGGVSFALLYCYGLLKFSESQHYLLRGLKSAMASVGSMSLTNYLLHSILLAFIFNGWGLGYYAKLPPEKYMFLVFPIYGFNLIFSSLWKKYFSMGPFEFVLRKFTYR